MTVAQHFQSNNAFYKNNHYQRGFVDRDHPLIRDGHLILAEYNTRNSKTSKSRFQLF